MWTCALLKRNAKQALNQRYWRSFAVCLLLGLLGVSSSGTFNYAMLFNTADTSPAGDGLYQGTSAALAGGAVRGAAYRVPYAQAALSASAIAAGFISVVVLVALALVCCWVIFLTNPLTVGRARYFMESRQAPAPIGAAFSVFDSGYMNIVKVTLLTDLKILAGSLLIIPGVYWGYCYRLVPYLLAENPYLTTRRAMDLSKAMMEGEKLHSLGLELSFFGWDLLAGLVPLGGLFLAPYYQATLAELYAALRSKAFAYGLSDGGELGGFVTHDLAGRG